MTSSLTTAGDHAVDAQRQRAGDNVREGRDFARFEWRHEARLETRLDSHDVQGEGSDHGPISQLQAQSVLQSTSVQPRLDSSIEEECADTDRIDTPPAFHKTTTQHDTTRGKHERVGALIWSHREDRITLVGPGGTHTVQLTLLTWRWAQ